MYYSHEPILKYIILIVLPVIIYYLFIFRGKVFVVYLILSISFTAGSLDILLNISTSQILQLPELLIWSLAGFILIGSPNRKIPYSPYLAGFLLTCLISYLINNVSIIQLLLFTRKYLLVVAIIIIFENLYLTTYTAKHLLKFIIFLFISQIFVNIARYPIVGIAELYIGSISVEGGSITAIFSLIGISFAFSAYIIERKVKYILLIFGFFIFSLIGDKRAQIIISPLIMLIQYFHFINIESKKIYHLVQIIPIIILSSIIVYIGVITIPTLNPENKIYGSFDINYLINFIDDYLFPAYPIKNIQQGRGEAPIAVYNLLTQRGWLYFFFGLGPGDIISSVFTIPSRIIGGEDFIAGIKYGIGYGTRTGLLFTVMQVGVVGLIFYLGIFFRIIQNVYKIYFNINPSINKNRNIILIGLIGALWIFVFDFLFYSKVFIYSMPIMVSILFAYKYLTLSPSYESGFKYGVFNTSR